MAAGQVLLNVGDPGHAGLFMLVSILVSISLIPMLLSSTRGPLMEAPTPMGIKDVYKSAPTGFVSAFLNGILQGGTIGMGAVYAGLHGLSISQISLFMIMLLVGGVCFQWPVGRLSDRFDRRLIILIVTFAAALAALLANLVDQSFPALLAAGFLFGGMMSPLYSLALAYANDHLAPEQMVAASGTLVLVGGAGAFLGPTIVAASMDIFGPRGFFWSLAVVHGLLGLFVLYRMTQRAALPADEQGSYVAMSSRATFVAGEMYGEAAIDDDQPDEDEVDGASSQMPPAGAPGGPPVN